MTKSLLLSTLVGALLSSVTIKATTSTADFLKESDVETLMQNSKYRLSIDASRNWQNQPYFYFAEQAMVAYNNSHPNGPSVSVQDMLSTMQTLPASILVVYNPGSSYATDYQSTINGEYAGCTPSKAFYNYSYNLKNDNGTAPYVRTSFPLASINPSYQLPFIPTQVSSTSTGATQYLPASIAGQIPMNGIPMAGAPGGSPLGYMATILYDASGVLGSGGIYKVVEWGSFYATKTYVNGLTLYPGLVDGVKTLEADARQVTPAPATAFPLNTITNVVPAYPATSPGSSAVTNLSSVK